MTSAADVKRYTREKRERILKRWEESGLSSGEFGREFGIPGATLRKWKAAEKKAEADR